MFPQMRLMWRLEREGAGGTETSGNSQPQDLARTEERKYSGLQKIFRGRVMCCSVRVLCEVRARQMFPRCRVSSVMLRSIVLNEIPHTKPAGLHTIVHSG